MKTTICALIAVLLVLPAQAQTPPVPDAAAGTNFAALKDYPAATCIKPQALPQKPIATSNMEVARYNRLIADYNTLGKAYVACVNAYVANASKDMDIIRQKSRAATDEANRP